MYYEPGLAAVQYDGDSTLSEMWVVYSQADQAPGGSVGSGSVMAKPVAGDIDGDGHLDIFLASQDVSPLGGYDGTIVRIDYQGNILATTFTWRACSGGLALGDTDNDGEFELYQGDRDMDYSDGGYGKGVKSYWAANLTERWIRLDDLTSSQAPILADVNGDGIQDIITGMYNNMWVLNSTNGEVIYHWRNNNLSVHYGTTAYDIDQDGHLELLCDDGDHDDQAYTDVFDLVTGEMDAQLSLADGDWKWGPLVADIDPTNPGPEIISCPNGTSVDNANENYWYGAIFIWNSDYESIQNVTRVPGNTPGTYGSGHLSTQLGFPVAQDIDGDGLLELLVDASSGAVYAFDTLAPAPGWTGNVADGLTKTERLRSEVTYYGEDRHGVARHTTMPGDEDYWSAPLVAPMYPGDNKLAIPVSTGELSFKLRDEQGDALSYSVMTMPDIGSTSDSIASGTIVWNELSLDISTLEYDTTYYWTVTADDGTETTSSMFTFRTELETPIGNSAPTQDQPTLVPDDGMGYVTSNFTTTAQGTDDINGNDVTNIYRWTVDGDSVNQVLLPFDTRSETSTKDYSGFGNDGEVIGAAWVPNGIVGGAYHFDGKDDAIVLSDGGAGFFNDQDSGDNHRELGGYGDWSSVTVEAWVYLDEYTNGSTIVGKIPSYALGFQSESSSANRLYGAVWPYTGEVADDDNQASVDRMRAITANVNFELETWYHIVFTYEDGVGMRLYVNGAQVAQSSSSGGPLSPSRGEPVYIGRLVQPFAGMIDDVRIFNYALPAEQVQNEYDNSATGDTSSSKYLPFGLASSGDDLACDVIPTDSYAEGTTSTTPSFEIINTPPVASDPEIYPLRVGDQRLQSQNLDAVYTYYDADGNPESGSEIRWYMDDDLQESYNDALQVPSSATVTGQEWYFTAIPSDGEDFGTMVTSDPITIYANTAPTTDVPSLVSSAGGNQDGEDLIATAQNTDDANGDDVTNVYTWTVNGNPYANLVMPFDTEVPLYIDHNGTVLDYSSIGNDGLNVGAMWIPDGVVGGAYSFPSGSAIRVQEVSNSLSGTGSLTQLSVESWIKVDGSGYPIMMQSTEGSTSYRLRVYDNSNNDRFRFYAYSGGLSTIVDFSDYENVGEWHHVVITYDGVALNLYIDGTMQVTTPFTDPIDSSSNGLLNLGNGFGGQMDEIRIYPRALSAEQIFQRYIETKDGSSASNTIVSQETSVGDDFAVTVIPIDSWEDGTPMTSSTLHVIANFENIAPKIDWYSPTADPVSVDEGSSIDFNQISSDPNGDTLSYSWTIDTIEQATTANWTYTPDSTAAPGPYTIRITVSDGLLTDYQEWTVNIVDTPIAD